jgi:hypothetical protein
MIDVGFRELKDTVVDLRNKQSVRRPYFMSASIPVPNGGRAKATLVCDQDADIQVSGLNGTVIAPSDALGRRFATLTIWPMPGVSGGYCDRGLIMRVYASSDKEDTLSDPENFMDAKTMLQPGYKIGGFSRPYPFSRYLQRDSKLTFEFINTDTYGVESGNVFHFVSLVLTCRKYEPFTR